MNCNFFAILYFLNCYQGMCEKFFEKSFPRIDEQGELLVYSTAEGRASQVWSYDSAVLFKDCLARSLIVRIRIPQGNWKSAF